MHVAWSEAVRACIIRCPKALVPEDTGCCTYYLLGVYVRQTGGISISISISIHCMLVTVQMMALGLV